MAGPVMGIDSAPLGQSGKGANGMGIDGPVHKSMGGKMGLPMKTLFDEAPSKDDVPEVEFGGHDDADDATSEEDGGHGDRASEADRQEAAPEDDDAPKTSESKLVRKLRMREDELSAERRENRRLKRELQNFQDGRASAAPALDKRDPVGGVTRMVRDLLGPKATDQERSAFVKELATDLLLEAQPELTERDPKLRDRLEGRKARAAVAAERDELLRLAEETKAERQRLKDESARAANDTAARGEVSKFLKLEGANYPYLSVLPEAMDDLMEVLDEMADDGSHDFGPGKDQGKRIAEGFRLGAARLDEYHRQRAEIYGKVPRKGTAPREDDTTNAGKNGTPGKRKASGTTLTRGMASRTGVRNPTRRDDDEPDPRMKFSDFVDTVRAEERQQRRTR